jgi:hypothetical protein
MRLILPLLACLTSSTIAAPIATPNNQATHDSLIIDRAISRSQTALSNLAKTIDTYYTTPTRNALTQQRLISDDAQSAIDALTQGANAIQSGPAATQMEKPRIVIAAKELLDQIRKTSDSWVKAKSLIVSNGGRGPIGESIRKEANAANSFAAALTGKMPGGQADGLAGWYARSVGEAVARAVVAFN